MALPADAVPARDGGRLALQGSLPLGGYLWHRDPASVRVRFLFDALPSGDGILRRHRSRGGGGVVARRAGGGGSLGYVRNLHGCRGALVSANLRGGNIGHRGGGGGVLASFCACHCWRGGGGGSETA